MAELAEQLQQSLGSSYTIVRELGGGGMSRVFLAEDNSLGRSVVFKVLLPELAAGVNAERFNREVQLSARLQHPHIVPVLSAGEVDGLPFYVMPFVKGESLRARLARGPMPIPEIISVLADVSKALAYAQADGIVHRDIKPDNILLSGGASTVADFGIAKAIHEAKRGDASKDPSELALTSLGTSLGTPAYMAPEQVAGDPNVDHRADIYSLGCVGYEMLTGKTPFAGKSPQQMLAAHVMEKPAPIASLRPDAPPGLVALVNRCLEKEPSARPQSASEMVTQLEASGTHESFSRPALPKPRKKLALAIVGGLVVLGAAAISAYRVFYKPAPPMGAVSIAVAPFEVLDPALGLWKEGMVDVLSRNLDGAGPIRSVPPSASIKKWEGHADRTVAMQFGKRVGAQIVVYGQLQPSGRDLVDAKVWVLDATRDAQPIEIQFRDSVGRMDRVTDSLSVKVLSAIGPYHSIREGRIASLGSGSLPAIKAFLQGSQYFRRTQWDSAAAAFREAVALDSTFGIAYLHLAQAIGWQKGAGDPEGNTANQKAGQGIRPGLSPHDSLFLAAVGHYGRVNVRGSRDIAETRAAIGAMQSAVDRYPRDPEAWYMLGDMRYHSDPSVTDREALEYFDHAIAADSDFAPAYIHAIELASRYGTEATRKYTDAYLRRDPRDVEGEGVRLAALAIDPKTTPQRLRAEVDTLPTRVVQKAFTAIARLPDSSETGIRLLRAAIEHARSPDTARLLSSLLANQLSLHGHVSEAWAITVKHPSYLIAEIAGLGLIQRDSAKKVLLPLFEQRNDAFLYPLPFLAATRDTATLIDATTRIEAAMRKDTSMARQPIINYVVSSMHAYVALARADTATAAKLFAGLADTVANIPFDRLVQARLIGKSDPKRALALLERHIPSPDLLYAARELERGRLAERIGDKDRAVDAYSFVAAAWRNTEVPQLRDGAKEAHDALQRLDSDGRVRAQLTSGAKP